MSEIDLDKMLAVSEAAATITHRYKDHWFDEGEITEALARAGVGYAQDARFIALFDPEKAARIIRMLKRRTEALVEARRCVGGEHPERGMDAPEDVWGILTEALTYDGSEKP